MRVEVVMSVLKPQLFSAPEDPSTVEHSSHAQIRTGSPQLAATDT